ncbi:Crp/Fnr family transcriptional regulator [Celerinatantimonas diazotrophica]|uniref:CRP-like cAMP-binding protein n=1 Tax=Celerinatantimonas diazotrophica TaxID=412034 RepID=A0A4R1K2E1_9GAMM|nr:cyclic nucleotide-binding domain-containing protein [Celerinatantimonas diazotrophica]TCK58100.1 CRP-like cAMP-binding protein [Celerinatantimonas diazotrophica]CAG9297828.1 hypothetical protein CEDIAZO_03019 [Celerinatantimonas diazotrophica]
MDKIQEIAKNGYQILCDVIAEMPLKNKVFYADEFILQQGEAISSLYWITLGEYSMHYCADNGKAFSLGQRFVSNCIIGELEYLTDTPSQFSVVANEQIDVKIIPISVMNDILCSHAQVGIWLSHLLSKSYQIGMARTMERFLQPLVFNVAMDIYQRYQQHKPLIEFNQVFREAERFGCSERTYRRAMTQLIEENYIQKNSDGYFISDLNKFELLLKHSSVGCDSLLST